MERYGTISVDLDALDSQLKGYGLVPKDYKNTVYDKAVHRFLDLFLEFNIKATFFVVGKDVLREDNRLIIKKISESGHEIANHTMNHLHGFKRLSRREKEKEIKDMEDVVSNIICEPIIGFRAPSWNVDEETIEILEERGYLYDSSIFPTYLLPLLRLAHFIKSRGKERFNSLGGRLIHGLSPTIPYTPSKGKIWKRGKMDIVEWPISVTPILRIPLYGTFLFSTGMYLFRSSLSGFRKRNSLFMYELHGIDLLDFKLDNVDVRLRRQPGMALSLPRKYELLKDVLSMINKEYRLIPAKDAIKRYLTTQSPF